MITDKVLKSIFKQKYLNFTTFTFSSGSKCEYLMFSYLDELNFFGFWPVGLKNEHK